MSLNNEGTRFSSESMGPLRRREGDVSVEQCEDDRRMVAALLKAQMKVDRLDPAMGKAYKVSSINYKMNHVWSEGSCLFYSSDDPEAVEK